MHVRGVPVTPHSGDGPSGAAQPADPRPRCAGIGDETGIAWACWECLLDIAAKRPKMPKYACANDNWIAPASGDAPQPAASAARGAPQPRFLAGVHQLLEAWGSVSIGLCGRDRLADYAARVLDRRERTIDRVAFHAGLQYLQPRRVCFCSCRSLPYKCAMLLVWEGWADLPYCERLFCVVGRWQRLGLLQVFRRCFKHRWLTIAHRPHRQRLSECFRKWNVAWRVAGLSQWHAVSDDS